jgi:hypothetical protein
VPRATRPAQELICNIPNNNRFVLTGLGACAGGSCKLSEAKALSAVTCAAGWGPASGATAAVSFSGVTVCSQNASDFGAMPTGCDTVRRRQRCDAVLT